MILQIDAGNSFVKWRISDGGDIVERGTQPTEVVTHAGLAIETTTTLSDALLCSVTNKALTQTLHDQVLNQFDIPLQLARVSQESAGVRCGYKSPETLCVDRWLAAVAAYQKFNGSVLVIDAGSAITMDLVGPLGEHVGGYILPGLTLMRKSLWQGTEAVQAEPAEAQSMLVPGTSTQDAVNRGCLLTVVAAIERIAGQYPATIVVTGGDGGLILNAMSLSGVHSPDLVLDGLAVPGIDYSGALDQ